MTDQPTFDAFEARVAGELERYVAAAVDRRSATKIAAIAMRPRRLGVGALDPTSRRRLLLLGLAAALLVPAALIGSGGIRPNPAVPDPAQPQPSAVARSLGAPSAAPPRTVPPARTYPQGVAAIFVRRVETGDPGIAVFAVRPDGAEALIRLVPDSALPVGKVAPWGTVSDSGWLALSVENQGGPWPMVLVDLRDAQAAPWVVSEASTGGIGPRWGPTGLVAADAGGIGAQVVIADPETRTTRLISMHGGLVGGGPSIVWTSDGAGIAGSTDTGYQTVPIDGGDPRPGVGAVYDPRGNWGDGLADLRICVLGGDCPGAADGRVERHQPDGSTQTIWVQEGADRALAANFGGTPGEYWLATSHADGTQIGLVHVTDGHAQIVATINRDAAWQYVGAPIEAPDHSATVVGLDLGGKSAAVVVPADSSPATFHAGAFAGFVDAAAIADPLAGGSATPGTTLPPVGQAYRLPSLDELIAAELAINPGERVLGKASHDAAEADTTTRTTQVQTEMPGGSVYLDCAGPTSVTVTTGAGSTTNPCLSAGSYIIDTGTSAPITVTARGDTSWRVVVYIQGPPATSGTAAPVGG